MYLLDSCKPLYHQDDAQLVPSMNLFWSAIPQTLISNHHHDISWATAAAGGKFPGLSFVVHQCTMMMIEWCHHFRSEWFWFSLWANFWANKQFVFGGNNQNGLKFGSQTRMEPFSLSSYVIFKLKNFGKKTYFQSYEKYCNSLRDENLETTTSNLFTLLSLNQRTEVP